MIILNTCYTVFFSPPCISSGIMYQRTSFDPKATGLQGLRWDDADLFEATAFPQMAYDDAFTLMEVWCVCVCMCVCVCVCMCVCVCVRACAHLRCNVIFITTSLFSLGHPVLQVEDKLVHKFNLVAGYVPVLKEYMEDVSHLQ